MHPLQQANTCGRTEVVLCIKYKALFAFCMTEDLPWPSCSMQWKGKQPSWNRIGRRFIPDLAASRCPSYSVYGADLHGNCWTQVQTFYYRLTKEEKTGGIPRCR